MTDLAFGRDVLGDAERASRLEWLVTNGIGGFASGTVSGALTRRYHGLLVAALKPPLARTLLLSKLSERIELDGVAIDLDTNAWASGTLAPRGHVHLESFRLEDSVPVWTWAIGDTHLEKRVWMEHGENTTYVQYRLLAGRGTVPLTLGVLVNHRDAHATTARGEGSARLEPATGGLRIEAGEGATPLWLLAPNAQFHVAPEWYRGFKLAIETERGLDDVEDHLCAGTITTRLQPGTAFTVVASTRRDAGVDEALLVGAPPREAPAWIEQLVRAADAFVVERASLADPNGRTIIAGYPWFSDWGRDTMIALPGLTLATGRPEIARAILTTFARHADQGMIPNFFPDEGEAPEYNTVDAALWYFQAVRAYFEVTGDEAFLAEVFPVLEDIGAWYERGTRFGIRVDEDGLVTQGADGVQLTWMDARVEDWVVTPRRGKPVEVNALWFNALTAMTLFAKRLKRSHENYAAMARRVEHAFARFWNADQGCLYDVIDGPAGPEARIRPNQIFAVSLPDTPLPAIQRRAVVETVGRHLVTSHGLRSLAPSDPGYRGTFVGDRRTRDGAYHMGTVWTWLLPHFALAHARVYGDRAAARGFLEPMGRLIAELGVGTLPEVADGDPPFTPRGCIAQAWSVAETLRVWTMLAGKTQRSRRRSSPRGARAGAAGS
jgi:predicted glycogen debranching enzyme